MPIVAQTSLPEVFLIGEHEAEYESKIKDYNVLLLTVCNNSMDEAYDKWSGMLIQMEEYADSIDYDIKGAKIWINVFWNKSGTIDHIIYYPKPNSKNMDFDRFTAFLKEFTTMYQMEVESTANFSHYGSASFPTHARLTGKSK
jgi:hypothetical protein